MCASVSRMTSKSDSVEEGGAVQEDERPVDNRNWFVE